MTATELLALLAQRQVTLTTAADELVIRADKATLDDELIALLRENKQALIDHLQSTAYVDVQSGTVSVPANLIPVDCDAITPAMLPLVEITQAEIDGIVRAVPGGAPNIQDIYPLAPLQEGILVHHLLTSDGDPYLLRTVLRFSSRGRLDAFIAALQAVIDRHDILRTAFVWEHTREPVQVVWRRARLATEEVTFQPDAGDVLKRLMDRFIPRRYRLDVRQAPLLHVAFAYDADSDRWVMLLLFHHLVSDHVAMDLVFHEIQVHLRGQQAQLPTPVPFRNVVTQTRLGMSNSAHEAFFRQILADVSETTAPFGLTDVNGDGSNITQVHHGLDPHLVTSLREQARALGVSVASMCHVAWACVLGALSGRDDVVFGTVLFGRMQGSDGFERVLGLLINTLPLRVKLGKADTRESVRATHEALAELVLHEQAPLALAQRCSAVAAPAPLFTALLNYRHIGRQETDAIAANAWEGIEILRADERTNYPITLSVNDLGDALSLTALVTSSVDATRVCTYMETALEQIVYTLAHEPSAAIGKLSILPRIERDQLLIEWNATEAEYPADSCVHELFEEQVLKAPDSIAVIDEDTRLTYADLNTRANLLARYLRSLGVNPDERVALCLERSPELTVALLAVLKAGGAYVPLDPSYPVERIALMIDDCNPTVVLTHDAVGRTVKEVLCSSGVPVVNVVSDAANWSDGSTENLDRAGLTSRHLAYVIYTSGSTGKPKGVMNEHHAVVNRLWWSQVGYPARSGDRVLQKTPYSFDVSVCEFFWPLINGLELIVARPNGHKDPIYLVDVIQKHEITTMHFVPSMLRVFLEFGTSANCPSVRQVICTGEPVTGSLARRFQECFPDAGLYNFYGPTEAAVEVTTWRCRGSEEAENVPIGRPIANARIYLLNARLEPVPVGVAGELYIGGVPVARGYFNRPDLTAERFIDSPFVLGERLYKTGDLARYRADGAIEFLGRNDFQVKVRGFRIELEEIESRLAAHTLIREAAVAARDDAFGEKRLVAHYVSRDGFDIPFDELRAHILAALPEYMTPNAFVRLDALPLTAIGKVDRAALQASESAAYRPLDAYEPPIGDIERAIARIWSDILGIDLAHIGRHDNFFYLGGHSLLAMRVLSRVRRDLQAELTLTQVFASPVLSDVARVAANTTAKNLMPAIARVDRECPLPVSFAQQRMWFLSQMSDVSKAYHIPLALRFSGALDHDVLRRALDTLVVRHEALRTTFALEGGKLVQHIGPASNGFSIVEHDLRSHTDSSEDLSRLLVLETSEAFDLQMGPLIRGRLIRLGDTEHVLLITMHHIVSDGWSLGILIHELSALYGAYREGRVDPLPALEIQYADYAAWQRRHLSGDALQEQMAYWQQTLAGIAAMHRIPTDRERPSQQDHRGAVIGFELDERLTGGLRALSLRHGTTLFTTLLTAWGIVLGRLSGETDVVIGTPVANRTRTEIEGLIGFFVNTLALRLDLSGDPRVGELLDRVKLQTLAAQEHQAVPFEQVVEVLQPPRSLAHTPVFQVMFAWQNNEGGRLSFPGLDVSGVAMGPPLAKFDLTLALSESGDRIVGGLEYATALFDGSTIDRYLGYLRAVVEALVADASQTIDRVALLSDAERDRVLVKWNATDAEYPSHRCVHELFEAQAARTPDAVAVVYEADQITYGELNARANRLARHLRGWGVGPDMCVALCMQRSLALVVAELAVLKCGAIYVPVDEYAPEERQTFMLDDCGARVVLSVSGTEVPDYSGVRRIDVDTLPDGVPNVNLGVPVDAEATAYVMYTSGSTGTPKGVMVPHRAISRLVINNGYAQFRVDDRVAFAANPAFDASTLEVWGPLLNGGCIVIIDFETVLIPERFAHELRAQEVTFLWLTSALFDQCASALNGVFEQLRYLMVGGDVLNSVTIGNVRRFNPPQHLLNGYGPTETTTFALTYEIIDAPDGKSIPIGRPISNTRAYILDVSGEPVPIGVAGELYIGGAGVSRGYLNRPELTAERFIASPFVEGDRLYKTGDMVRYLADGNIEYLGRNDFQVKIRGFRIELGEIEARLAEHEFVRAVVVLAREDAPGDKRLVAYYTVHDGAVVSAEQLRTHVQATLPEYMVPAAYVVVDSLPLTPNGKFDRKALPAPDGDAYVTRAYEEPVGHVEEAIAHVWRQLLKVERVGRHDNFFELGGHSLLSIDMIGRLRSVGLDGDVRSIFGSPTLRDFASSVSDGNRKRIVVPPNMIPPNAQSISPTMLPLVKLTQLEIDRIVAAVDGGAANVQDIYPLAPLQEGLLFHYLLASNGDPHVFRKPLRFATRAALDAYAEALQAVIDRQDICRTAFAWEGLSEPVQVVWRRAKLIVEDVVVPSESSDVLGSLMRHFDQPRNRMDVRCAPIIRLGIAHDRQAKCWLAVRFAHDLISDHYSVELMDDEIQSHIRGEHLPVPLPFRDFIGSIRLDTSREEHEVFFREMIGDVVEPTAPFGLLETAENAEIVHGYHPLPKALVERLRAQARAYGVSVGSLFHVAWARVLAAISGRDDVVFGTVLFGRTGQEGADRAMGLFINTLPFRVTVDSKTVSEQVVETHRLLAKLMHHENAPLALAQRCSGVPAPTPLFGTFINYRHSKKFAESLGEFGLEVWLQEQESGEGHSVGAYYPLIIEIDDLGPGILLTVQVEAPYDAKRICRYLHAALGRLTDALESAPSLPIKRIDVLPDEERHRILVDWNATAAEYPSDRCVHELFELQAARTPDAVAVKYEDTRLTYGELDARANGLARHLRAIGVVPDMRVAVCFERSVEMVVGVVAVLKAGGAYVPLDPSYPLERLRYMLEDSAPVAVLTHGAVKVPVREMLAASSAAVIDMHANASEWSGYGIDLERPPLLPEHLAYVIYTSGSTGEPKGVMVEHRNVCNYVAWSRSSYVPDSGSIVSSSLSFDATVTSLFVPLAHGSSVRLLAERRELEALDECVLQLRDPGLIKITPAHLELLGRRVSAEPLSLTNTFVVGGEALPLSTVRTWRELQPQARLINEYGPTEATVGCVTFEVPQDVEDLKEVPIGRPIANVRIYILDANGAPVPMGVAGELYIGGAGVARGYLNRPEMTAERFIASPFVAGDRLYKTGDVARYLPDGTIEYLGRNDFQVKIRGFRIELGEIEARLADHESVRNAVVLAREDVSGDKRLVAYYTVRDGAAVGVEVLRAHVQATLPKYMVPAVYVAVDSLPLTLNGKVDRSALPAPGNESFVVRSYEAPDGDLERAIARIWSDILGVDLARIGRNQNFFELGGHSLLAVRMLSHMRRDLQVEFGITRVFESPVLMDIARAVADVRGAIQRPISPADREKPLPLSFAQQRLWFLAQMEGVSEAYHILLGLRLRGDLDRQALRDTLDHLVLRHEPLRTTFSAIDGDPVQAIAPFGRLALKEHDLRSHDDATAELERVRLAEATAPFDLIAGPPIRGRLIRTADREHVLLLTMHHIVSDGWSLGILVAELSEIYRARLENEPVKLPSLDVQYADYAAWQREHFSGPALQERLGYWARTLKGIPEVHHVPTDRPRPAQQDYAGDYVRVEIDAGLTNGLRLLSRMHGATLFMTLLTGWGLLLGRLSGEHDIVIGTPVANRERAELEGLIGCFVNTLALRLDISGEPRVGELLDRVKAQTLAAQEHQDVPFEQVVELLNPQRSLSQTPLFQASFAWQNMKIGNLVLPGLNISGIGSLTVSAKFDLTLNLVEIGDKIVGSLEFATSLFDRSTVERYVGYLLNILSAMAADDEQAAATLPMLTDAERERLVVQWNATDVAYPADRCVHELFEEQVCRTPEAAAVTGEGVQHSYIELNNKANQLAHFLRAQGVEPGTCVALCMKRSFALVVAELAVLKCGAIYVPVDEYAPEERQAFMLDDCGARIVLSVSGTEMPDCSGVRRIDVDTLPDGVPSANLGVPVDAEAIAYVMYTSGSTGTPKGVRVPHRAISRLVINNGYAQFRVDDRVAFAANPAFDASTMEVWGPLLNGGRLVVVDREALLEPVRFAQLVEHDGLTVLFVTTALFNQYAATIPHALKRLRVLLCGGEQSDPAAFACVLRAGGPQHLIHCYGPTETTTFATTHEVTGVPAGTVSIPIGRPISNTRVYILDTNVQPVPVGVAGELYIGGAGVAHGYLNRPELTVERFIASPFVEGDRLYKTGDMVRYLADGNIEYLGRNDFQVKIRGFRIELGEVEARLAEHDLVRAVVVLAREDVPGDKRLVAYYTVHDGAAVGAEELRAHVQATLPEYMMPAAYVVVDSLPLTPNGKVNRQALPAPNSDAYSTFTYEPPAGEVEQTIACIWSELLGLERIGRHDNFFQLGGHSLLAVRVLSRMRGAGLHADIRSLFSMPVLSRFAAVVGGEGVVVSVPPNRLAQGAATITPSMLSLIDLSQEEVDRIVATVPGGARNVQEIYPLAPLQEGILFHHLLSVVGDPYLLSSIQRFDDRGRLDKFVAALQAVIDRHDILRTAIVWEGLREPVQVVCREARLAVQEIPCDPSSGAAVRQLTERFSFRNYRIDVQQAPLFRVAVSPEASGNGWMMVLMYHHLVCDHLAMEVVFREMSAYFLGEMESLPPPVQFRNVVAQARLGISRDEHEAFFRQMLGDVDETTAAFGLTDVHRDGSGVAQARRMLDPGLSKRLREQARAIGVSTASVCHLAWARFLAAVSNRDDVVFGTVLFGRAHGEGADGILGLLMNTLPVRFNVAQGDLKQGALAMHNALAELMRHEQASLTLAQRCSAIPTPAPLFSALLNYRHIGRIANGSRAEDAWAGMAFLGAEERTNYPLTVSIDDFGRDLGLTVQAVETVDPESVCDYLQATLEQLVDKLEHAPHTPICEVSVVPEIERRRVLFDWNETATPLTAERFVHEIFQDHAARAPDVTAIAWENTELTYGELNARANRLARYLRRRGVQPDTRVALCFNNRGPEAIVSLLAVLKAGGAYVLLRPMHSIERLRRILEDSGPVVTLTCGGILPAVDQLLRSVAVPFIDLQIDAANWNDESSCDLERAGLTLQHLAYVSYESAVDGPIGVMVEHRSLCNMLDFMRVERRARSTDRVLVMGDVDSNIAAFELLVPLVSGARAFLVTSDNEQDESMLAGFIAEHDATIVYASSSTWRALIESGWQGKRDLKVLCGGEPLSAELAMRVEERVESLLQTYGLTETTTWSSANNWSLS